jgi:hypothetical protein
MQLFIYYYKKILSFFLSVFFYKILMLCSRLSVNKML